MGRSTPKMQPIGLVLTVTLLLGPALALGQTTVFSDNFDDGSPGGSVLQANWPWTELPGFFKQSVPGEVNGHKIHVLNGSDASALKNHTASPDVGGSAYEVDNNPTPYSAYHEFDPQTGTLRVEAWVWDDVESRKPQGWPDPAQINGGLALTAVPEPSPGTYPDGPNGPNTLFVYGDFAFLGIQALIPQNKPDPNDPGFDPFDPAHAEQYCYQWRTKTDGWNLTLDPDTGNPVPRREDFRIPWQIPQTWRHLEILIHPYTGQVGDIQFYIDGVLVGEGQRDPGSNCQGVPFRRIQIGSRFPEESDVLAVRPPYSYEHLWFDDVELTADEAAGLPCVNDELRFDADADGDVDHGDFSAFQACLGTIQDCSLTCRCMNSDGDPDVDEDDYIAFEQCASGPGVPADQTCDDALLPP